MWPNRKIFACLKNELLVGIIDMNIDLLGL